MDDRFQAPHVLRRLRTKRANTRAGAARRKTYKGAGSSRRHNGGESKRRGATRPPHPQSAKPEDSERPLLFALMEKKYRGDYTRHPNFDGVALMAHTYTNYATGRRVDGEVYRYRAGKKMLLVPKRYVCGISLQVMLDPVREAFSGDSAPCCFDGGALMGLAMSDKQACQHIVKAKCVRDLSLRFEIMLYLASNPRVAELGLVHLSMHTERYLYQRLIDGINMADTAAVAHPLRFGVFQLPDATPAGRGRRYTTSHGRSASHGQDDESVSPTRPLQTSRRLGKSRDQGSFSRVKRKELTYEIRGRSYPLNKLLADCISNNKFSRFSSILEDLSPAKRNEAVNEIDKSGSTLIHHCSWHNRAEFLERIIREGANVNHQNLRKNAGLHLACERGNKEVCTMLVKYGADLFIKNLKGETPADKIKESEREAEIARLGKVERVKLVVDATHDYLRVTLYEIKGIPKPPRDSWFAAKAHLPTPRVVIWTSSTRGVNAHPSCAKRTILHVDGTPKSRAVFNSSVILRLKRSLKHKWLSVYVYDGDGTKVVSMGEMGIVRSRGRRAHLDMLRSAEWGGRPSIDQAGTGGTATLSLSSHLDQTEVDADAANLTRRKVEVALLELEGLPKGVVSEGRSAPSLQLTMCLCQVANREAKTYSRTSNVVTWDEKYHKSEQRNAAPATPRTPRSPRSPRRAAPGSPPHGRPTFDLTAAPLSARGSAAVSTFSGKRLLSPSAHAQHSHLRLVLREAGASAQQPPIAEGVIGLASMREGLVCVDLKPPRRRRRRGGASSSPIASRVDPSAWSECCAVFNFPHMVLSVDLLGVEGLHSSSRQYIAGSLVTGSGHRASNTAIWRAGDANAGASESIPQSATSHNLSKKNGKAEEMRILGRSVRHFIAYPVAQNADLKTLFLELLVKRHRIDSNDTVLARFRFPIKDLRRASISRRAPIQGSAGAGEATARVQLVSDLPRRIVRSVSKAMGPKSLGGGRNAMHCAVSCGDIAVLRMLLEHAGPERVLQLVDSPDEKGQTPFHMLALKDWPEAARELLKILPPNSHLDNHKDLSALTPLSYCAVGNRAELMGVLLDSGLFEIAAQDGDGWTALHFAAHGGHDDCVKVLLKWAAPVSAPDARRATPLHLALAAGRVSVVRTLVKQHADVNACDEDGVAPIHEAAHRKSLDAMRILCDAGADLEAPDGRGSLWTPLHYAVFHKAAGMVSFLLEHDVKPNPLDRKRATPLHLAASHRDAKVTRALLAARASTSAVDAGGLTPLHRAAAGGNLDVVRALVEAKAFVDVRDRKQWTPLCAAACVGRTRVVSELVRRSRADPTLRTSHGLAPLHLAAYWDRVEVARAILDGAQNPMQLLSQQVSKSQVAGGSGGGVIGPYSFAGHIRHAAVTIGPGSRPIDVALKAGSRATYELLAERAGVPVDLDRIAMMIRGPESRHKHYNDGITSEEIDRAETERLARKPDKFAMLMQGAASKD